MNNKLVNMSDFLKNFEIDRWYKILIYIGGIIFIISLFLDVQWLTNKGLGLLGLSLFCIGLGEWKNEKTAIQPTFGGFFKYQIRHPDLVGWIFLISGGVFLLLFFREVL